MTTTPQQTRHDQFRERLIGVLSDLQQTAQEDGEAVAIIGSLATELADKLGAQSWSDAKDAMSQDNYWELLRAFERQGVSLHQAGETKKAYAIQALAISIAAVMMRDDRTIAEGEGLIDGLIDRAVTLYRRNPVKRH